jgi:hypothetical protein
MADFLSICRAAALRNMKTTMKRKLAILLTALVGAGIVFSTASKATGFEIPVGDRPYYEGPGFWDYGWYWEWMPGHRQDHHWVHGYYQREGEWSPDHLDEHHDWPHPHHHHHRHSD